jgi:transposase-like protein
MKESNSQMLDGTVEVDETFIGGKAKNMHASQRAKKIQGRGSVGKEIVIGIRKRNGDLRFFHIEDVASGTLARYIHDNISQDVEVVITDDFPAYDKGVGAFKSRHKTVNHSSGVYVHGSVHTNTVESAFSLLKRGIFGTWHNISAKHLPAYLDEMTFRFNRRQRSDLFLDTLRYMVTANPLTFSALTADSDSSSQTVSPSS